ncbi:MAG: acylphosphatase [Proteobacteria bacterium]|nr:acylphosphatase [Pseudomonadota bacterium]
MTASQEAPLNECRRVLAQGRVQGVGFRDSCLQQARALGIKGWVRNRSDGSVEAVIQGAPAVLDAMCRWLAHDVPGARVDALQVQPLARPCENMSGFERRPTA